MDLDPESYRCPDDSADLTSHVMAALKRSLERAFLLLEGKRTQPGTPPGVAKAFEVIVLCPGSGAQPPHDITLTGTYTL